MGTILPDNRDKSMPGKVTNYDRTKLRTSETMVEYKTVTIRPWNWESVRDGIGGAILQYHRNGWRVKGYSQGEERHDGADRKVHEIRFERRGSNPTYREDGGSE